MRSVRRSSILLLFHAPAAATAATARGSARQGNRDRFVIQPKSHPHLWGRSFNYWPKPKRKLSKNCEVNKQKIKPKPRPWEGSTTLSFSGTESFGNVVGLYSWSFCLKKKKKKKKTSALTAPGQEKGIIPFHTLTKVKFTNTQKQTLTCTTDLQTSQNFPTAQK